MRSSLRTFLESVKKVVESSAITDITVKFSDGTEMTYTWGGK